MILLAALTFAACSNEDEFQLTDYKFETGENGMLTPVNIQPFSQKDFQENILGTGWERCMEAHRVYDDGTVEKKNYYEGRMGHLQTYFFFTEEVCTMYYNSALESIPVYTPCSYAYSEETNTLAYQHINATILGYDREKGILTTLKTVTAPENEGGKGLLIESFRRITDERMEQIRSEHITNEDNLMYWFEHLTEEEYELMRSGQLEWPIGI